MVISSTTQWTIPLSRSALSTPSPPAPARQSQVLGLKPCQLSAATSLSEPHRHSHHQDLHSTSSRRLRGADNATCRRSAGSFRQLVHDDFFAKVGHESPPSSPASHGTCRSKELEPAYDGIAMPWRSHLLRSLDAGTPSSTASHGNLIDLHGDITADDVDLLPMPGLLSCPSPFVASSSYASHRQTPTSPSNVGLAFSDGSKSHLMVPNFLGLPPEFDTEMTMDDSMQECSDLVGGACLEGVPLTPTVTIEHARCGGKHLFCAGHGQSGKEGDVFADSLAGLWSLPASTGYMLQDSENLASIFNVYPQNFHGLSSAEQSCFDPCKCESAQCVIDGLPCVTNVNRFGLQERDNESGMLDGSLLAHHSFGLDDLVDTTVLKADPAHRNPCIVTSPPSLSMLKSSVKVSNGFAVSQSSSLSSYKSHAELSPPPKKVGESVNLKRPFSALDLTIMATSATSDGSCITRFPSLEVVSTEEHEDLDRFTSFLCNSGSDPKLVGSNLQHHIALSGVANAGQEMSPKPPPAKIRRKHGTAMDPQSVAARTRREKFSDRIRTLQSLIPNGERLDTVSMLSQTLEYVKFLQHQVWHLYHGKDPALFPASCEKWKDFVEAGTASVN